MSEVETQQLGNLLQSSATLAVISDVNGNLDALKAVLDHVWKEGIDDIICLGNFVDLPDPIECADLVRSRCRVVLCGEREQAILRPRKGAEEAPGRSLAELDSLRKMLKPGLLAGADRKDRWRFLEKLPARHEEGDRMFSHGSPIDPHQGSPMPDVPDSPAWRDTMTRTFSLVKGALFVGQMREPSLVTDDLSFHRPAAIGNRWITGGAKGIVRVGAVATSYDDGDTRASYVVVSPRTVEWRRVDYDLEPGRARLRRLRIEGKL